MSVGGIGGWIAAPTGGRSARSTPPRTLGSPCIISSPLGAVQARSASVGGLSACPELTTRPFATREPAPQARREFFLFFLPIPPGVNAGDCCSATDRVPEWQRSRQTGGASARERARWIPSFRLSCEAGTQLSEEQRRGDDLNRAVLYMTAAAVLIPLLNASAKYLAVTYPVLEVAWARYAGHFIYMLLFFLPQRGISWHDALLFFGLGLFGGFGHYFIVRGYEIAPAPFVSPFNYLQLIGAALLGFVVFGQLPDVFVWCGAAIIAGSGIAMLYVERRGRAAAKTAPRLSPGGIA